MFSTALCGKLSFLCLDSLLIKCTVFRANSQFYVNLLPRRQLYGVKLLLCFFTLGFTFYCDMIEKTEINNINLKK